jgi:hypothetical protein
MTPAGVKVNISRGQRVSRVSAEWFSRPDDERYLSLSELYGAFRLRADCASARTVKRRIVRVEASRDDAARMALIVPGRDAPVAPIHWSFGQLCSLVGAPAGYLWDLPAPLPAINLQHGLLSHRGDLVMTLEAEDGRVELRAVTGPDYGRIRNHELVGAVMKIAGDGTGNTRWKVPGILDGAKIRHNRFVDLTKDTTTLYASDRDVFLFLVDDTHAPDRGWSPDEWRPGPLFPGFLLMEYRGRVENTWHRFVLSACRRHEPEPVGRRRFSANQHPAQQVRRQAFRARSGTRADPLCQLVAGAVHRRHPRRARSDHRPCPCHRAIRQRGNEMPTRPDWRRVRACILEPT